MRNSPSSASGMRPRTRLCSKSSEVPGRKLRCSLQSPPRGPSVPRPTTIILRCIIDGAAEKDHLAFFSSSWCTLSTYRPVTGFCACIVIASSTFVSLSKCFPRVSETSSAVVASSNSVTGASIRRICMGCQSSQASSPALSRSASTVPGIGVDVDGCGCCCCC